MAGGIYNAQVGNSQSKHIPDQVQIMPLARVIPRGSPGGPTGRAAPRPSAKACGGFSLVEIMIAMALLATGMVAVLSNVYSLNAAQIAGREEAKVQILANQMIERVMGANFVSLGQAIGASIQADQNAWSWHRRATCAPGTLAPVNLPMAENIPASDPTYATRDLVALGLEDKPSGVKDLRVYLEYYSMNVMTDLANAANAGLAPLAAWKAEVGDVTKTDPTTSPPTIPAAASPTTATSIFPPENSSGAGAIDLGNIKSNTTSQNDAVLVRILVFWTANAGGPRWHEVAIVRRK